MEPAAESSKSCVVKLEFKLKSKPRDGEILQLHHTVRGAGGEPRRIRFIWATFHDVSERLACADNGGNLFILDFSHLLFWKLSQVGPCSSITFAPDPLDALLVADTNEAFDVRFLDVETGSISETLSGHTAPVKHISFSSSNVGYLLTGSASEAIIWEMKNYTKYFTLHTYKGALIEQILFAPVSDNVVACFQNDTVQIWKHDTMKSIKQIIPSELKHMRCIAFSANGRAMVMAGLTPTIILFSLDTWKAIKSIDLTRFRLSGVREAAFIPQVFDGGSNKILAVLSSNCALHIFDLEAVALLHTVSPESSTIKKLVVSPNGKYFACVLKMGEVNIFNSSQVMDMVNSCKGDIVSSGESTGKEIKQIFGGHKRNADDETESQMKVCLDGARLRRILSEYSEYPEQYRSIIWRALLNTPRNKNAYISLVNKPIHPSYKDIEKQFTIHSAVTLKNLKRLLSCLAHWCQLFAVMPFLPGFVFPFVRVLQKDPLLLFESVTSILINYCQLWFEYAPFPPINILAIIENVLGEHDKPLLEHLCKYGITNQIYALKILETAFSEVLSCSEWLIVWDHILSNEPAFMLMAVVAYNIVQRNAILKLTTHEQFEDFYHMQNPLDKKGFLKKCYLLLKTTSSDIHPRRYLTAYSAMEKGLAYPQFGGYPKATVCLKLAENERKEAKKNENKMSLKELTARSQEKELSDRYGRGEDSSLSCSDEASFSDEEFGSGDEQRVLKLNTNKSTRELKERNDTEELGNIKGQSPENESNSEGTGANREVRQRLSELGKSDVGLERLVSRLSSGGSKKKPSLESGHLEKQVNKLMKELSETDL